MTIKTSDVWKICNDVFSYLLTNDKYCMTAAICYILKYLAVNKWEKEFSMNFNLVVYVVLCISQFKNRYFIWKAIIIFSSWITLNTSMPSHHVQWFKSFYIMYKHFYWNEKYIFPERYGQKLSKKSDVCRKKYLTRHTQSIYCCMIIACAM